MNEDDDLFEKYVIKDKVRGNIKKEFDSKPVNSKKKKFKTKRKYHGDEASDFYAEKIPKVVSNHTCLVVIRLDSVLKKDENYYPQVFLKECK